MGKKFSKTLLLGSLLCAIFYSVPSAFAQQDDSRFRVEPIRTRGEATEIIGVLGKQLTTANGQFKTNQALIVSAETEADLYSAQLADETREAALPAVDGFILSNNVESDADDPSSQLRARFIGAQIISDDEEAISRIRKIQSQLETSRLRLDLLEKDNEALSSTISDTEAVIAQEQVWLGKINERAIHDRGRDGATRTLVEVLNKGSKQGFYLQTCPVNGPHNAIDSWGAPRSSGRLHKGVDIMAGIGVEILAPASGNVVLKWGGNTGGNVFQLRGDNGVYYYGSHLDSLAGSSRRVEAGELIGYVGKTGNARYTDPHLHFEIHPGGKGSPAINPTPDTAQVCNGVNASVKWRG